MAKWTQTLSSKKACRIKREQIVAVVDKRRATWKYSFEVATLSLLKAPSKSSRLIPRACNYSAHLRPPDLPPSPVSGDGPELYDKRGFGLYLLRKSQSLFNLRPPPQALRTVFGKGV